MKILFCDNTLWGLINFRGDVISHFVDKGHDVILVAPEKEDKQLVTSVPQGVRYVPIKMGRTTTSPVNDLKYFCRLFKIIRREKPNFVFNYTIKPNIYGSIAAHLCGCRTTAMMAGLGYVFKRQSIKTKIARMLYKTGLSFTDYLLLLNEENRNVVVGNHICKRDKIILLKGGEGVNLDKFCFYDNQDDNVTFLFIGRVLWEKGYEEFVNAAKLVKKEYSNVRFKVLGALDPSYPDSVPAERIKRDEADGTIEYCGFTSDMKSVYQKKGLVITLPTYYGEGMNRSLMEACASGKPIITTDIAGCRELVVNGKNGYLVRPRSPESLASAMTDYLKLTSDERKEFSLNSRKIAETVFDIKDVIKIYDKIISGYNS